MNLRLLGGEEVLGRCSLLPGIRLPHGILVEDVPIRVFVALVVDRAPSLDVNRLVDLTALKRLENILLVLDHHFTY